MNDDVFDTCLTITLKWEGGYSNDPHDKGGPTQWGIIQTVYDGYRDRIGAPKQSVKKLTKDEMRAIYKRNYWDAVRGDDLANISPALALVVWDFGVNSGVSRAIKYLQKCLGVVVDGHLGEATLSACRRTDVKMLIAKYQADRLAFLKQIKTFWRFGKGWTRRVEGISKSALAMMNGGEIPDTVIAEGTARAVPDSKPDSGVGLAASVATFSGTAIAIKQATDAFKDLQDSIMSIIGSGAWVVAGMASVGVGVWLWKAHGPRLKELL